MSPLADPPIASFVDGDRLWRRLQDLARFGATPNGGVSRLALSPEEIAAAVGYATATSLRNHLTAEVGLLPGAYRRTFQQPAAETVPASSPR